MALQGDFNEYTQIQFHDKIRKVPSIFVFLSYRKNFVGTRKRIRIIQGEEEPTVFESSRFFNFGQVR